MHNPYQKNNRPAISNEIKREVRKRCGFGCVICGLPLYDYEHMEGWANVHRHVAEEITLLCVQHHREKTTGMLPTAKVRESNAHPINIKNGTSNPYELHFEGNAAEILIGGNSFKVEKNDNFTSFQPLVIDGIPIINFTFQDERLLLNIIAFDSDNIPTLQIQDNELVYDTRAWDIKFVGRKLIINQQARDILIELEFIPPNKISINRGHLLFNGIDIKISTNKLAIQNIDAHFKSCDLINTSSGIVLGSFSNNFSAALCLERIPRYKNKTPQK